MFFTWSASAHHFLTSITTNVYILPICQQSWGLCTTILTQYLRFLLLAGLTASLVFSAWGHVGFWNVLWTVTDSGWRIFIFTVLMCSVLSGFLARMCYTCINSHLTLTLTFTVLATNRCRSVALLVLSGLLLIAEHLCNGVWWTGIEVAATQWCNYKCRRWHRAAKGTDAFIYGV